MPRSKQDEKPILDVVVDTNLLVRALIGGPSSYPFWQAWERKHIRLVTCQEMLEELLEVLTRPRLRRYFPLADIEKLLSLLRAHGHWIKLPKERIKLCRDPKDDLFINLAIASGAHYLVSADKDLTEDEELKTLVRRTYGIHIVTINEFTDALKAKGLL